MTIHRDDAPPLSVEVDAQGFDLTDTQEQHLEEDLDVLRPLVADFPTKRLHVQAQHHARSGEYEVNASLVLPDRTLPAGERSDHLSRALRRSVRHLARAVSAYKAELAGDETRRKTQEGTHHDLVPGAPIDAEGVAAAAKRGDYAAFRKRLAPFEEPLRLRAGRWIQRDEDMEVALQHELDLEDVVEETFLHAFEGWAERPPNVPFGTWLDQLIEPSLGALRRHPDRERRNLEAVRTWRDAAREGETEA